MAENNTIATMSVNVGGQMQYASGVWQSGQLTTSALVRYAQGNTSASVRQEAVSELLSGRQLNEQQIQFVQSQFEKDVALYQELLTDKRFVNALQQANESLAYVPSDTQSPVSERFIQGLIEQNTSGLTADEIRKLCALVTTKEAVFPNGVRFGFQREKLLTNFIVNANQSVLCADLLKEFVATDRPCEFILDDGGVKARKAGGLYAWKYQQQENQIQYVGADIQLKSNVFDETIYHEMRHHVTTPQINDARMRANQNPIFHFISEVDTCVYDCFFDSRIRDNQIVSSIIERCRQQAIQQNSNLTQTEQIRLGNDKARHILMKLYLTSPEERIDYYKELRKDGVLELPDDFDKVTAINKVIPETQNTGLWHSLNDMERLTEAWAHYYAPNYVTEMKKYLENSVNEQKGINGFVEQYHTSDVMAYIQENLGLQGVPSAHFAQYLGEKYLNLPQNQNISGLVPLIQNGTTLATQSYFAIHPKEVNQSFKIGQGTINLTPLHYALRENRLDTVHMLLQNPNIDLTIQNEQGESPFGVLLSKVGQSNVDKQLLTETAKMMIAQKAPIITADNASLFEQAVRSDSADILNYVLSECKNAYTTDKNLLLTYIQHRQSFDTFTLDENIVRQLVDFGSFPQTDLSPEMFEQLRSYPFKDEKLRTVFASITPPAENNTLTDVSEPTENEENPEKIQQTSTEPEIQPSDSKNEVQPETENPTESNTQPLSEDSNQTEVQRDAPAEDKNTEEQTSSEPNKPKTNHTPARSQTTRPKTHSQERKTVRPATVPSTSQPVVQPNINTPQNTPRQMETPQNNPQVSDIQSGVMPQSDNARQNDKAEADKQSFLERNWEWLVGLGIAIAVGIGAYFLIRNQKKKTKTAENTVSELNSEVSSLKDKLNAMQTQQNTDTSTNNGNATNTDGIIGLRPIISDDTYNR